MSFRTKLTNSSDETAISKLISGDTIFTIPYFQRPYKWKPDKLKQLNDDILNIVDLDDKHFLGAVIVHGIKSNPADPNRYDIIDGQQRVTTLILYLCAVVKVLCVKKFHDEAHGLFSKYLVIPRATSLPSNLKLYPCKEDRQQINDVYGQLLVDKEFSKRLNFDLKYLPSTGKDRGALKNNYNSAVRWLKAQVEAEGIDRLREIYKAILEDISVVQIDVWDASNGPKIFDSLNSRQEPMTIGDLVRNAIFSKVTATNMGDIEQIDEHNWQPFYNGFEEGGKNLFDAYFFPYGLIKNINVKKSEVFTSLREDWDKISDAKIIITELQVYQNAFIDISSGTNRQKHDRDVANLFRQLTDAGVPASTYPFIMRLSNAILDGTIGKVEGKKILETIESFLVRRAICGHEPTGLHAVFKRLWTDCDGKPTQGSVEATIKEHKTVFWPNNEEFSTAVKKRAVYGSAVTRFVLLQYDNSLKGDKPENIPWIEHILPQKMSKDWEKLFTSEQHEQLHNTLANLLPLTSEMNGGLSNSGYSKKKVKFAEGSAFKSARDLANSYVSWGPDDIKARSEVLANWASTRWSR